MAISVGTQKNLTKFKEQRAMTKYRVECNYGSRYFSNATKAFAFFKKCKDRNLDVEIWIVTYCIDEQVKRYSATQELLDYSFTNLPKQ